MQPNAPGTQGYNRYAYVANNPATWTDPSGHNAGPGTCELAVQFGSAVGIWVAAKIVGYFIGKHRLGTYAIYINAAYGTALGAVLLPEGLSRFLTTLIGGFALALGKLVIQVAIFGETHVSVGAGFGILLAGVLLLLMAVLLEQLASALEWWSGVAGRWCGSGNVENEPSLPTSHSKQTIEGSHRQSLDSAALSMPALPSPSIPQPGR